MHIGLLLYGTLDALSGGYLYDRRLVAYLDEQGDDVEIISLPWRNYIRHLSDNFSSGFRNHLKRLDIDVLLQDELNHPSLFILNQGLRRQINYPIVSIIHLLRSAEGHPAYLNPLYRWIERSYLASVDGFIYNSLTTRQAAEQLLCNANISRRPSLVAYPGGNRFQPEISIAEIVHRAQRDALRLVFLGNVIPRKGLHVVLKALRQLPTDQWMLTVIGSANINPPYGRAINRQIVRHRLSSHVHFAGILPDSEVADYLRTSHLLVMPSVYEGYGIVYCEGMGFGLPAIGSISGAAKEIITHNRDGFLISPGDHMALANYLKALAQNRQHLLEMSLAARNRYKSLPTWEESTKDIRTFLTEIV